MEKLYSIFPTELTVHSPRKMVKLAGREYPELLQSLFKGLRSTDVPRGYSYTILKSLKLKNVVNSKYSYVAYVDDIDGLNTGLNGLDHVFTTTVNNNGSELTIENKKQEKDSHRVMDVHLNIKRGGEYIKTHLLTVHYDVGSYPHHWGKLADLYRFINRISIEHAECHEGIELIRSLVRVIILMVWDKNDVNLAESVKDLDEMASANWLNDDYSHVTQLHVDVIKPNEIRLSFKSNEGKELNITMKGNTLRLGGDKSNTCSLSNRMEVTIVKKGFNCECEKYSLVTPDEVIIGSPFLVTSPVNVVKDLLSSGNIIRLITEFDTQLFGDANEGFHKFLDKFCSVYNVEVIR